MEASGACYLPPEGLTGPLGLGVEIRAVPIEPGEAACEVPEGSTSEPIDQQ